MAQFFSYIYCRLFFYNFLSGKLQGENLKKISNIVKFNKKNIIFLM
jgi:hypothetical protein